jgi:hypothetical protein
VLLWGREDYASPLPTFRKPRTHAATWPPGRLYCSRCGFQCIAATYYGLIAARLPI